MLPPPLLLLLLFKARQSNQYQERQFLLTITLLPFNSKSKTLSQVAVTGQYYFYSEVRVAQKEKVCVCVISDAYGCGRASSSTWHLQLTTLMKY